MFERVKDYFNDLVAKVKNYFDKKQQRKKARYELPRNKKMLKIINHIKEQNKNCLTEDDVLNISIITFAQNLKKETIYPFSDRFKENPHSLVNDAKFIAPYFKILPDNVRKEHDELLRIIRSRNHYELPNEPAKLPSLEYHSHKRPVNMTRTTGKMLKGNSLTR